MAKQINVPEVPQGIGRLIKWVLAVIIPVTVVWTATKSAIADLAVQYNYNVTHPVAAGQPALPIEPHFNLWGGLGDVIGSIEPIWLVVAVLVAVIVWLLARKPSATPPTPAP